MSLELRWSVSVLVCMWRVCITQWWNTCRPLISPLLGIQLFVSHSDFHAYSLFVFKCMFTCLSFEQTVKWQGAVQRSETLGLFSSTCSAQQCDLCSSLPVRKKEASKERPSLEVFQFGLEWRPLQSPQANSQVWGGFRPLLPRVHCSQASLPPPLCLFWLFHLFPPVLLLARLWWQMTLWE